MLYVGNSAEPSRCASNDNDASSADSACGSDDLACCCTRSACDDRNSADRNYAADYDDRTADADHDEGRGTGCEHYTGNAGTWDESGDNADG